MEIKTYPEMNETIKDLLRRSEEPMNLYTLARIQELEKLEKQLAARGFAGGPGDDSIEVIRPVQGSKDMALEPCPFCGSTNVVYERYSSKAGERWRCWCTDCIASIDPGYAQSRGPVQRMWNRRAVPPNDPLTLEELRKMDGEPVYFYFGSGFGEWALAMERSELYDEVCLRNKNGLPSPARFVIEGGGNIYRRKPEEADNERNG